MATESPGLPAVFKTPHEIFTICHSNFLSIFAISPPEMPRWKSFINENKFPFPYLITLDKDDNPKVGRMTKGGQINMKNSKIINMWGFFLATKGKVSLENVSVSIGPQINDYLIEFGILLGRKPEETFREIEPRLTQTLESIKEIWEGNN